MLRSLCVVCTFFLTLAFGRDGKAQGIPPEWKEGFRAVTPQEIRPLVGTWRSPDENQVIAISADGAIYEDTASGDFWGGRGYFHDGKIWLEVNVFHNVWVYDLKHEADGKTIMHLSYNSDGMVRKSGAYHQESSADPKSSDIKLLPVPADAVVCWSKRLGEWGTQWVHSDYYFKAMKVPHKGGLAYYLAGLPRYDNDQYWGIGTCSVCTTEQFHQFTDAIKRLSTEGKKCVIAGKEWNSEPATIKTLNVVGDDEIPDPDDNSFYHPGVRWYSKVERRESVLIVLGWSTGKDYGIDVHMTNGEIPVFSFKSVDVPTLLLLLNTVENGQVQRKLFTTNSSR